MERKKMAKEEKKYYALIPCEDKVFVCEFDGTFDEGEGMSMGYPIQWKNPNITKEIMLACMLNGYKENVDYWVKFIMQEYHVDEVYVEGLIGGSGWWTKEDVGMM
jgi:hypothetical protein